MHGYTSSSTQIGNAPVPWLRVQPAAQYYVRHLPRAPSPETVITRVRAMSRTASEDITPPSSLLRAHAPHQNPHADFRSSPIQRVFAGCYEPLLEVGGSRRYLHSLCIGAWTHTPPPPSGALARCFPEGIGLAIGISRSAGGIPLDCNFTREFLSEAAVIPLCSGSYAC